MIEILAEQYTRALDTYNYWRTEEAAHLANMAIGAVNGQMLNVARANAQAAENNLNVAWVALLEYENVWTEENSGT